MDVIKLPATIVRQTNGSSDGGLSNPLLKKICLANDRILTQLESVTFQRGQVVVAANETLRHVYFPSSGICSVVASAEQSKRRIEVGVVGREGLVGLSSVLGTDRAPHECVVQVEGTGHRIEAKVFREVLAESPAAAQLLLRFAQVLLVQAEQTALANGRFSIEKRLARWVLMCHDRVDGNELHFTHEALAATLGVRRPGITVATHVLEGNQMIRATRGRITVLNREKLEDAAGGSYGAPEAEYERLIGTFRRVRADAPDRLPQSHARAEDYRHV